MSTLRRGGAFDIHDTNRTMRLIIFDFDGTLADTRGVIVRTLQDTVAALGLPRRTDAECAATIGLPLEGGFAQLCPDLSADVLARCAETYRVLFDRNNTPGLVPLFPHVAETLRALRARGYTLTIASSRGRDTLTGFVRSLGMEDAFTYVVGADDVTHHKPHAEPVLRTLAHFGLDAAADVWVVGDMTFDVLMGRDAGVRTVGVTYGNGTRAELEAAGADYVIDDLRQLLHIIDSTALDDDLTPLPEGHFVRSH